MLSADAVRTPSQGEDKARRAVVAALACIVLAALALRVTALALRQVVFYDETYYYILGKNLFSGKGYALNGLPHTAFLPLYPILAGLASLFTQGISSATSIVSALAGAAAPIPVYFLARLYFGRVTGLVSAAFAAFWPALFFFAGRNVPYADRLYSGSEPLFLVLVTTGILFIALTTRLGRARHAVAAGVFFGLATLTRNEGPLLAFFAGGWFLVVALAGSSIARTRILKLYALMAAVLLVTVAPWLLHVYRVSGSISMGSKASNLVRVRGALWEWIVDDDATRYICIHYALNDDATWMEDAYWGASQWHRQRARDAGEPSAILALAGNPDLRWARLMAKSFYKGAVPLVPVYMLPAAALGVVLALVDARSRSLVGLLVALGAAHLVQAVFVYTIARFELTLVMPIAIFAAAGTCAPGRLVKRVAPGLRVLAAIVYILPAAALLAVMCRSGVRANIDGSVPQADRPQFTARERDLQMAALLREEIPEGATLMCHEPWTAIWSGAEWRVCPAATPDKILKYVRLHGIDYALLAPWQILPPDPGTTLFPYVIGQFESGAWLLCFKEDARAGTEGGAPAREGSAESGG